jgi:hypothetical protein
LANFFKSFATSSRTHLHSLMEQMVFLGAWTKSLSRSDFFMEFFCKNSTQKDLPQLSTTWKGAQDFPTFIFEFCQIWLSIPMDNHHLSNITKLKKKPVLSFRSIMLAFEGITLFMFLKKIPVIPGEYLVGTCQVSYSKS